MDSAQEKHLQDRAAEASVIDGYESAPPMKSPNDVTDNRIVEHTTWPHSISWHWGDSAGMTVRASQPA